MRNLRFSFGSWSERGILSLISLLLLSILLFNAADAKRSACWRYGHSCWGGHGKRNGGGPPLDYAPALLEKSPRRLLPLQLVSKMLRANGASSLRLNKRAQDENNELRKMDEEYSKESSPEKSLNDSEFSSVDNSIFTRNRKRLQSSNYGFGEREDGTSLEYEGRGNNKFGPWWGLRQ